MLDLRKFYLDNVQPDEYYYSFYDLISKVNMTYNIFEGEQETENYIFEVFDMEEAISYLKNHVNLNMIVTIKNLMQGSISPYSICLNPDMS